MNARQMKKNLAAVCCCLLLTCAGCGVKKQPIKLGYIGSLSGASASIGELEVRGIMLAIEETNDKGGVCGGRRLSLVLRDDESDPAKSIIMAQKLATEEKVLLAFATNTSQTTLADLQVFTRARIPQITGALVADITERGSAFIFRATPAGPAYETTLVDYLARKGFKRFALISDTSAYGRGEADYQQAALRKNGLQSLIREAYNSGTTDYSPQLKRILTRRPEVLLLGALAVDSGQIARQARLLGFAGQIAGGSSIGTPKFIEVAGAAAEGAVFSNAYIDNDLNERTRDFSLRYKKKWGEEPVNHAAKGYDAAMLAIFAIEKSCGEPTGDRIARQLHAIEGYQGVQGVFTFQKTGEGIIRAQIGVIKNNRLTAVKD
jgi:branched-chain amino acid transport system substrate-binding protein